MGSNLRWRPLLMLMLAVCALGFSHALVGQAVNGTLLGTLTDASGASVANAKVTAIESSTGAIHEASTNDSGNYTFPDLQPGLYTVAAEAKEIGRASCRERV